MQKIEQSHFAKLAKATNEYIDICKNLPQEMQFLFRVENVPLLTEWDSFYQTLKTAIDIQSDYIKLTNLQFNKFLYYANLLAKFFAHNGDEKDLPYVAQVENFILKNTRYKAINAKVEEDMFWKAFPELKKND